MTKVLLPYPEYKDSGLQWLGAIPASWEIRRNGRLFSQRKETGFPDLPVLEVSLKTGVRLRDFENSKRKQVMEDFGKYKRAVKGDIAYNMMRMWQGAVGVAPVDGLISPAYVVARPWTETQSRYYSYLFRTAAYMNEVNKYSHGIVSDRNRLYWDEFKQIPSAFPPPDEQVKIADFLDAIGNKFRRFIRNKRRLIELLNKQKQNIINQAVTRGLDPNVKLKPSGVEWLGDIPEHWEIVPIKHLAKKGNKTFTDGDWIETPFITNTGIRLIQTGNVGIGIYREKGFRYISETTFRNFNCTEVFPGDVLICRLGDPVSRACLAPNLNSRMITSVDVCILKPNQIIDSEFIVAVFSSPRYLNWVKSLVRGSTRDRVSRAMLGGFKVPIPPFDEQRKICTTTKQKFSYIDDTITRSEKEIELIREYRARLISDVVTGKIDVRGMPVEAISKDDLVAIEEETEELDDTVNDEGGMDEDN